MTEIADDRSWWADVEHLCPDGERPRPAPPKTAAAVVESPAVPDAEQPSVRHRRITGESADRPVRARPRRADVAAFADAMDLDGAFGAPVPSPRSREIVLTGTPSATARERMPGVTADADLREAARGRGDAGRETVQITGTGGLQAEVAERRALREVGARRPRSAVNRVVQRPDRIAMYVVLLGLFLVFIAATGSSAGS